MLTAFSVNSVLQSQNVRTVSYQELADLPCEQQRQAMLAADIGISSADYAVAETGTVVVASGCGRERSVTLLPPVLVTIVDGSVIVPDLFDLFDKLDELPNTPEQPGSSETSADFRKADVRGGILQELGELPSNLALITGPSKTGDIELQLTTGVHGPGEWHVIIVEQARTF